MHTSSRLSPTDALAPFSDNLEARLRAALKRECRRMGQAALCSSLPLERNMEYQKHRWTANTLLDILNGEIGYERDY